MFPLQQGLGFRHANDALDFLVLDAHFHRTDDRVLNDLIAIGRIGAVGQFEFQIEPTVAVHSLPLDTELRPLLGGETVQGASQNPAAVHAQQLGHDQEGKVVLHPVGRRFE